MTFKLAGKMPAQCPVFHQPNFIHREKSRARYWITRRECIWYGWSDVTAGRRFAFFRVSLNGAHYAACSARVGVDTRGKTHFHVAFTQRTSRIGVLEWGIPYKETCQFAAIRSFSLRGIIQLIAINDRRATVYTGYRENAVGSRESRAGMSGFEYWTWDGMRCSKKNCAM